MRCVDCLPLIEEYFDGETDARTGELMSAHLSACADCAAALDALRFEQEVFARYDRGLEVTPALWAAVSAEVARGPLPTKDADGRPFLKRLRDRLAATLGALTLRPALASSLALLVVGVTAGALWLAHVRPVRNVAPPSQSAKNESNSSATVNPSPASTKTQGGGAPIGNTVNDGAGVAAVIQPGPRRESGERIEEAKYTSAPAKSAPAESVEKLLAYTPPAAGNSGIVVIKSDDHETGQDLPVFVNTAGADRGVVTADARLADPGDKEVARHVEKAQMLLRSFKNARPAEGDTVNVAYEKTLSRKLLSENATLQLDAETRGDKDTEQVLDQLEPFLLDIANLRDRPSREEVRSIRERMRKNEIIAALQVY
jgi:hypothetical protein